MHPPSRDEADPDVTPGREGGRPALERRQHRRLREKLVRDVRERPALVASAQSHAYRYVGIGLTLLAVASLGLLGVGPFAS